MSKVPGTFRNNGGRNVPPNINWDPDEPIYLHSCSGFLVHLNDCDGNCERGKQLSELEVKLVNENREWARIGMSTDNVGHDIFTINAQVRSLIRLLEKKGIFSRDEIDIMFQECMLEELISIRMKNQDAVKRASLGIPSPGIILPGGN